MAGLSLGNRLRGSTGLSSGGRLSAGTGLYFGGFAFSPASLFAAGEQGVWYDPSDLTTLFQDSAGTTPVTAVEQPVGRMLDKSGRNNHATQSTSAARPVLSARVNLLTKTEQFDDAVWNASGLRTLQITANSVTAPDGTLTADKAVEALAAAGSVIQRVIFSDSSASAVKRFSVYGKKAERKRIYLFVNGSDRGGWFDLDLGTCGAATDWPGGTVSIQDVGSGWYRCTLEPGTASSSFVQIAVIRDNATTFDQRVGDGVSGVYLWGADLRATNDGVGLPVYQRVNTTTDYDTTGFPLYLRFDGTDDFMTFSTVTTTVGATGFAGMNTLGISSTANIYDGQGGITSYTGGNSQDYSLGFRRDTGNLLTANLFAESLSTGVELRSSATNLVQPYVLTGSVSVSAMTLRLNGVQAATGAGVSSTLKVQALAKDPTIAQPYLFGRLYSIIWVAKILTAQQISDTETWVNGKTKAYA